MIGKLLTMLIAYETTVQAKEIVERHQYYRMSREYCNTVGKPLLRIGLKRSPFEPPNGDVTLDLDPEVENVPGGVYGDMRSMPFLDGEFGVCFAEHVLEHLHEPEDVETTINECVRVADRAVLLAPSPYSIYGSLFQPTHYLRLWFDNKENRIIAQRNNWRLGFGYSPGISQSLTVDKIRFPLVISAKTPS